MRWLSWKLVAVGAVLAAVASFGMASTVLADGDDGSGPRPREPRFRPFGGGPPPFAQELAQRVLHGTVKEKSEAGDSLVLSTRGYEEVTVLVDSETRYLIPAMPDATLDDVNIGDQVIVHGQRQDGQFEAQRVIVVPVGGLKDRIQGRIEEHRQHRGPDRNNHPGVARHLIARVARVGDVTAVSSESVTISGFNGAEVTTFVVTSDTEVKLPEGDDALSVGDRALVRGRFDREQNQLIAQHIRVLPSSPEPEAD
jgi:hypothetical protein